jgi:HAMP domain-containing protein
MCLGMIWNDFFSSIKTCKVKNQLMICYISTISVIMLVLILMLYIALTVLGEATINQIETTINEVATEDTVNFVGEYSKAIQNQLTTIVMLSDYLNFYVSNFYSDSLPFYQPSITDFNNLPIGCMSISGLYDHQQISMNYSSITYYSSAPVSNNFTNVLGFAAYVLPDLFNSMSPYLHRLLMYVPKEQSLIVFPGQKMPPEYFPGTSDWYNRTFLASKSTPYMFVDDYFDMINVDASVVSFVQNTSIKAFNSTYQVILNAEIRSIDLLMLIPSSIYLNKEEIKVITTNQGRIIASTNSIISIDTVLWDSVLKFNYNQNLFSLQNGSFYRVSFQSVPGNLTDIGSIWFFVLVFTEENVVMLYKNESQYNLEFYSLWLLGITIAIAFVVVAISAVIINFIGKSIAKPLEGIKKMTDRINAGKTDVEHELEKLEEGIDQVADLVKAFKSLVGIILQRNNADIINTSKKKIYPPNELYLTDRITWKESFSTIPY